MESEKIKSEIHSAFRAEEVLRLVNYKEPSMTSIERAEAEELKKMDVKIIDMRIRLEQLKKKSEQTVHANGIESSVKRKEIVFTRNQEEAAKENLCQMYVSLKNICNSKSIIRNL